MNFQQITTGIHLEGLALDGHNLWYSDVMAGGIHRLAVDSTRASWRHDALCIGGLLINADGKVLSTGEGGIAWTDPATGAGGMLITEADGQPILGVNEMAVWRDGGIAFGTLDTPAFTQNRDPGPSALYLLSANGEVTKLCDGLKFSNGLAFSADHRWLYHNESFVGTFAYELDDQGKVTDVKQLLDKPDCDGIKVDEKGRLWISGFSSSELVILRPDGAIDDTLVLPAEACTNLLFGGGGSKDLYITTVAAYAVDSATEVQLYDERESILYRGRSTVAGRPIVKSNFHIA